MPGFGGAGAPSPWGNAPPAIAAWLDANWGSPNVPGMARPSPGPWRHQMGPPSGLGPALPPAGARPPLLNGRVPLGAAPRTKLVGPGYNPGNPMNVGQMAPVPMKNPPPPGSLLAALFNAKGPLPPQGFAGTMPPPTGLPMGVRDTNVPTTPSPLTPQGGPPLTPQGLDPNYQRLFGLNPTHFAMPQAQTNSTFGNVGKGWPFM